MLGELAIYVLLAVFIFSRLYISLGKSGTTLTNDASKIIENLTQMHQEEELPKCVSQHNQEDFSDIIRQIKKIDPVFSIQGFINGATKAFALILEALNNGDRETLRELLDKAQYTLFEQKMQDRENKKEKHCTTIVSVNVDSITDIKLEKNAIIISVQFVSEQISHIKDSDCKIIKGSEEKILTMRDKWIFSQFIPSQSSKWLLIATE